MAKTIKQLNMEVTQALYEAAKCKKTMDDELIKYNLGKKGFKQYDNCDGYDLIIAEEEYMIKFRQVTRLKRKLYREYKRKYKSTKKLDFGY